MPPEERKETFIHKFSSGSPFKILMAVLIVAVTFGIGTGYMLAPNASSNGNRIALIEKEPETAAQDDRLCRDFAEGKVTPRPTPKNGQGYTEGTHTLVRDGANPVALTSSVVDLSKYENKTVKVTGETQKALKEGWLIDVCRVEEK